MLATSCSAVCVGKMGVQVSLSSSAMMVAASKAVKEERKGVQRSAQDGRASEKNGAAELRSPVLLPCWRPCSLRLWQHKVRVPFSDHKSLTSFAGLDVRRWSSLKEISNVPLRTVPDIRTGISPDFFGRTRRAFFVSSWFGSLKNKVAALRSEACSFTAYRASKIALRAILFSSRALWDWSKLHYAC